MAKKRPDPAPIEPREFRSIDEIDTAIAKIQRRIRDLEQLDVISAVLNDTGAFNVLRSDVRETIREVFGTNSPESREHKYIDLWGGEMQLDMPDTEEAIKGYRCGRQQVITILKGLISRLKEKKEDLGGAGAASAPSTYFDRLNLHPRILDVSRDLFLDGYHWEAVFAAAKALVNYIKERSGRHDLDGATLVRTVFSKSNPILAFNDLSDQTDQDEQEGMMHLFEGAVLGIRNPGGHSFPEGPEQRAVEYMSLLSLLAYRVQEATRRKKP
jgi:uncharacterized protein (TIGR02391 family)